MKVYYKTIDGWEKLQRSKYHDPIRDQRCRYSHNSVGVEPCCDKMKEAWDESYIDFEDMNNNVMICIEKQGYDDAEHMAITFCPFCATKIEVVEKERVKLKAIEKERKAEKYIDYVEEKE